MTLSAARSSTSASVAILIVDDTASKRLALRAILAPLGHRIVEADSGIAALRCVMAEDFAAIVLDVCMPIMDGFETAALIRERRQSELTPLIFVTAFSADEIDQASHYVEGAVDFIVGPVVPAELRAKISVFANLSIRADEHAKRAGEVQASADELRLLTDAAPIGIFQTDAENNYVSTNPCWSEITGIPAVEAEGRPWDMVIDVRERAGLEAALGDGPARRTEFCHRFQLGPATSKPRTVLLTSRALPDVAGRRGGWVGTLADVTAEATAEIAMSAARDTALAAKEMQVDFTASASHELKTPTTSILGFVEEVLEGDALSEQDRGFLEIVLRNAQRLSRLIDDLLILGETDVDTFLAPSEPVSLVLLVERVMSNFGATADGARVTLVTDLDPDAPLALADAQRVEQALTNLVSNAIKFTPDSGVVTVSIRTGIDTVDVSVADCGIGIAPEDIENIFDRFFRTKLASEGAVQGTGLGLAIAKRMIEAQGGSLSVTSTLGVGSTFTIALPIVDRALEVVG